MNKFSFTIIASQIFFLLVIISSCHLEKETKSTAQEESPISKQEIRAFTEFEKSVLIATLDTIHIEDQRYRKQISEIEEKYGRDSDEMRTHLETINKIDASNLIKVEKILNDYGWLGADIVGTKGNRTIFLVLQHAPLEAKIKYLPMMRMAVKKGNASASSLALLEDRTALGQGKRQIYGSQIRGNRETGEYFVAALIDPEKVNERRAEVGLDSIEDYVRTWNIIWNVEKHIARIEKMEK